jgi:putative peptidoglycan lipid II flippase
LYSALFHRFSVVGLAIASDLGILANTIGLAVLLHRRKLVPAGDLRWDELGKAAVTAVVAGYLSYRISLNFSVQGRRIEDVLSLAAITLTWGAAVGLGLWLLRSDLPRDLRRRKPTAYPRVAERQAEETSAGIEP